MTTTQTPTSFRIRITVDEGPSLLGGGVLPAASEVVEVSAASLADARATSMVQATLSAQGRKVRFFNDDDGEELFGRF